MLQLHLRRLFVGWFLLIFIYGLVLVPNSFIVHSFSFYSLTWLYHWTGGTGAGGAGAASLGGARVPTGAGGTGGAGAAGPGGARTRGTGAAGAGGVGGAGAGGAGAGDPGAGGVGTGGTGAGGAWAGGAGAGDPGARGTGAGGTVQRRPFFVPSPPLSLPPLDSILRQSVVSLSLVLPHLFALFALVVVFLVHVLLLSPAQIMALRPSSVPLRVPLPPPLESSLPAIPDPESDLARAASPTVSRLLATVDTDPSFESTAASALVAELVDLAGAYRLDYATSLVAESESGCPPSVGGECALGTDVLEDRQKEGSRYQCNLHYTDYKGEI
ncbi:unnamed protein product [Closterium sp. NIES-54]